MADESLSTIFLDTLYIIIKLRGKVVRGDILPAECYLSQGSRSLAPLIMSGSWDQVLWSLNSRANYPTL